MKFLPLIALLALPLTGCTSLYLKNSTSAQGQTVTDLRYQMILDNLAMLRYMPGALPSHIAIGGGTVTVTDSVSPRADFVLEGVSQALGISGTHSQQQVWNIAPHNNPVLLEKVRQLYQANTNAAWLGTGRPPKGALTGRYKSTLVWVAPENVSELTKFTLELLRKEQGIVKKRASAAEAASDPSFAPQIMIYPGTQFQLQ